MWQCEWATACKWLLIKMAQLIMIITAQEDGEREKAEERKSDVLHLLWKDFKLEGPKKSWPRTTRDTFSPSHELTNHAREKYTVILSDIIPQLIINHCCSSSSSDYGPIYTNVYDHAPIATLRCLGSASAAVNLDSVPIKIFGSKYLSICLSVSISFILRI